MNNKRYLGLDVSKATVTVCLLLEKPADIIAYARSKKHFEIFHADSHGLKLLLEFIGDRSDVIAVAEPTGVNYLKLWSTHLARAGIELRLVDHKKLKEHRKALRLPDKKDTNDALALALYGMQYGDNNREFLQVRDFTIVRIRELVLQLAHLNRVQSPIINYARQKLAWQFPEAALINSRRLPEGENLPLLWAWIAGKKKSAKYDRLYAATGGSGLKDDVRRHAERICGIQEEEIVIERELRSLLLEDVRFDKYRKVFKEFGFGLRIQSILISQVFPIENYLVDGKPDVKFYPGEKRNTKRHLSLARFLKGLGCAPREESSGDLENKVSSGGSDICKTALFQWCFTRIEIKHARVKHCNIQVEKGYQFRENGKPDGKWITVMETLPLNIALHKKFDEMKINKTPIRLARSQLINYAMRLLFRILCRM